MMPTIWQRLWLVFSLKLIVRFISLGNVINAEMMQVILMGETSLFKCSFHPAALKTVWSFGDRNISISSIKDGKHTGETDMAKHISILRIRNTQFIDAGDYYCNQFFKFKRPERSVFTLKVQGSPRLSLHNNVSIENDIICARCCVGIAKTNDLTSILWFIHEDPISPRKNATLVIENKQGYLDICSNVSFPSIRDIDGVPLICLVRNELNLSTSKMLKVMYPPSVRMVMTSYVIVIHKEKNFKVLCEAEGNPHAAVTLQKNVQGSWSTLTVKPSPISMTRYTTSWAFHFGEWNNSVKGEYRCLAVNTYGESFSNEKVEIVEMKQKEYITMCVFIAVVIVVTLVTAFIVKEKRQECFQQSTNRSCNNLNGTNEEPHYLTILNLPSKTHENENDDTHAQDSIPEEPKQPSSHEYEVNINQSQANPHYYTLERVSHDTKL